MGLPRYLTRTGVLGALCFTAMGLSGCRSTEPNRASWVITFSDPNLQANAESIEVRILSGSCKGEPAYTTDLKASSPPALPPVLKPGTYGLAAYVRNSVCSTYAEGCREVTLPQDSSELQITVTPKAETLNCGAGLCVAGKCEDPATIVSECGNGTLEPSEDCDGTSLRSQTCETLQFESGTLACNAQCRYETSGCVRAVDPTPYALLGTGGDKLALHRFKRSTSEWAPVNEDLQIGGQVQWVVAAPPGPNRPQWVAAVLSAPMGATKSTLTLLHQAPGERITIDLSSPTLLPADLSSRRPMDLACEQLSGRCVVVYGDETNNPLFRTYDPRASTGAWSNASKVFTSVPGDGAIEWLTLVSRPGVNELSVASTIRLATPEDDPENGIPDTNVDRRWVAARYKNSAWAPYRFETRGGSYVDLLDVHLSTSTIGYGGGSTHPLFAVVRYECCAFMKAYRITSPEDDMLMAFLGPSGDNVVPWEFSLGSGGPGKLWFFPDPSSNYMLLAREGGEQTMWNGTKFDAEEFEPPSIGDDAPIDAVWLPQPKQLVIGFGVRSPPPSRGAGAITWQLNGSSQSVWTVESSLFAPSSIAQVQSLRLASLAPQNRAIGVFLDTNRAYWTGYFEGPDWKYFSRGRLTDTLGSTASGRVRPFDVFLMPPQ